LYDSYREIEHETKKILNEILEFVGTLKSIEHKTHYEKDLIVFLGGILKKFYQFDKKLRSNPSYEIANDCFGKKDAADRMIKDFFFEHENRIHTRVGCAYELAFSIQVLFLDARVMRELYDLRSKRLLFIHTGQAHTAHISRLLRVLGFELKFQISNDQETMRLLRNVHGAQEHEAAFKSVEMAPCYVDVEEFLGYCSTLPKRTAIALDPVKAVLGAGVIAAGAYIAYKHFFRANKLISK